MLIIYPSAQFIECLLLFQESAQEALVGGGQLASQGALGSAHRLAGSMGSSYICVHRASCGIVFPSEPCRWVSRGAREMPDRGGGAGKHQPHPTPVSSCTPRSGSSPAPASQRALRSPTRRPASERTAALCAGGGSQARLPHRALCSCQHSSLLAEA